VYYTFGRKKVGKHLGDLLGEGSMLRGGAIFDGRGQITRERYAFSDGGFGGHGLGVF
jgi:hypothetical protein